MNIHSSTKKILSEGTCFSEGGILCLAVGILEIKQKDTERSGMLLPRHTCKSYYKKYSTYYWNVVLTAKS
jgi:hypothetical protein